MPSRTSEIYTELKKTPLGDGARAREFFSRGFEANSKEQYLAWIAEWKDLYRWLSGAIRELKGMRKQFRYAYRDPEMNTEKRRTKIGENPNYESGANFTYHISFRYLAQNMMDARMAAKIEAGIRMKKSREEAA